MAAAVRLPRIENLDAKAVEILHIPREDDKAVLKSRHAIMPSMVLAGAPQLAGCV
jgi:hypothetical protein